YAAKQMKMFLKEKDVDMAKTWPLKRIEQFIEDGLRTAGQDASFLSKANLILLQQAFGPMFRQLNQQNPRISQKAKVLVPVNLATLQRQTFTESALKAHGTVYYAPGSVDGFTHDEQNLWADYQKKKQAVAQVGPENLSEDTRQIAKSLEPVPAA